MGRFVIIGITLFISLVEFFYLSFGFISSIGLLSYNIIYIYHIYIYHIYIYIIYIYHIYIYIIHHLLLFSIVSYHLLGWYLYLRILYPASPIVIFQDAVGSDGPWMQGVYRVLLTAYGSDRDSMGIWWWSSGISRGYKDGFFRGFFLDDGDIMGFYVDITI